MCSSDDKNERRVGGGKGYDKKKKKEENGMKSGQQCLIFFFVQGCFGRDCDQRLGFESPPVYHFESLGAHITQRLFLSSVHSRIMKGQVFYNDITTLFENQDEIESSIDFEKVLATAGGDEE